MKSHWNLELPDCILTGAALDFEEDYKKALETVKKYLNEIISKSKNTWIITGGSNKGVNIKIIIFILILIEILGNETCRRNC